jgi:hypothetical protein
VDVAGRHDGQHVLQAGAHVLVPRHRVHHTVRLEE